MISKNYSDSCVAITEGDNYCSKFRKGTRKLIIQSLFFIHHKQKINNACINYVCVVGNKYGKWELNLTHECQILV